MLAEEDLELRTAIATVLREDGHFVAEVRDESEAMGKLASGFFEGKRHGGFDLFVYDPTGPSRRATHALEAMRHAHWETPAMVLVPCGESEAMRAIEREGGVPFEKPFTMDELRDAIDDVLRATLERKDFEDREEPIVALVATRDSGMDAWAVQWLLESHGIQAFLAARTSGGAALETDVYVLEHELERARALLGD